MKYGYENGQPIDPGPGWRLLGLHERIEDGDEWWLHGWYGVLTTIGDIVAKTSLRAIRRRIATTSTAGWQKVAPDNLPEANRAVWTFNNSGLHMWTTGIVNPGILVGHSAHWRYCEGQFQIPPPPVSEDDEAFEKWFEEHVRNMPDRPQPLKAAWTAALQHARKEGR